MYFIKKEGLVVKVISFVMMAVFLWMNSVWATGVSSYKLSAPSQVTALVPMVDAFASGQKAVKQLAGAEIKTKEEFYRELGKGRAGELAGIPCLVFSDREDESKLAYYVFNPYEPYFSRITTHPEVNDSFWNVISRLGERKLSEKVVFDIEGRIYYQQAFAVLDSDLNFIISCLELAYPRFKREQFMDAMPRGMKIVWDLLGKNKADGAHGLLPEELDEGDYEPKAGPKIVSIGGGSGPKRLADGMAYYTGNMTNVITVFDNGTSTGVLRDFLDIPAVGDLRQRIIALLHLVSSDNLLSSILGYRLSVDKTQDELIEELRNVISAKETEAGGEIQSDIKKKLGEIVDFYITNYADVPLKDMSFGNIILAGEYFRCGQNLTRAVRNILKILGLDAYTRIAPVSEANLDIAARLNDGTVIYGEYQINHDKKPDAVIEEIFFVERGKKERVSPPEAVTGVLESIRGADAIVIGPGSLYTSCIPNLMVKGVNEAIRESKAAKILVVNLMEYNEREKIWETKGYKASDIVREVLKTLREPGCEDTDYVDYVLVNSCGDREGYIPVDIDGLKQLGLKVIVEDLEDEENPGYHDTEKISKIIMKIMSYHGACGPIGEMNVLSGGDLEDMLKAVSAVFNEIAEAQGPDGRIEDAKRRIWQVSENRVLQDRYDEMYSRFMERGIDPEKQREMAGRFDQDVNTYDVLAGYPFEKGFLGIIKEKVIGPLRRIIPRNKIFIPPLKGLHCTIYNPWGINTENYGDRLPLVLEGIEGIIGITNPFDIYWEGVDIGENGSVVLKGYVFDNEIFGLRRRLCEGVGREWNPDVVHITVGRIIQPLDETELAGLKKWLRETYNLPLGIMHIDEAKIVWYDKVIGTGNMRAERTVKMRGMKKGASGIAAGFVNGDGMEGMVDMSIFNAGAFKVVDSAS